MPASAGSPRRPNLFDYATSELSQDAFLAWLARWSDATFRDEDPSLHQVGQAFVRALIAKAGSKISIPAIERIDVYQQKYKVDVLLVVNDAYAIIIEDKVLTGDHGKQLSNYLKSVKDGESRGPSPLKSFNCENIMNHAGFAGGSIS